MKGFLNKDERQIIWRKLDRVDLEVLRVAHNPTYVPMVNIAFYAAKNGYLELLQWVRNYEPSTIADCVYTAIEHEHFNILKWLKDENLIPDYYNICCGASQLGYLNVLKWARLNDIPWTRYTCHIAKSHNHLELLQWARDNGAPEWAENNEL
jgi:hypothetical protein